MSYYDLSHVTDVGLQGSAGPSVSHWDIFQQSIRQQFRTDSARALDDELQSRWLESLRSLRAAGQNFNAPVDPLMYRGFAQFVRDGTPITTPTIEGTGFGARVNEDVRQPHPEFEELRRANEAIRQLNNPEIKTFEQILAEVSDMQRGVEEETASMRERGPTGSFIAELLGAAVGSFTQRDPLNIVTAPIGFGRTIAMRIASDMGIAGAVTAATEFGDVQPNRALAQLPERSPIFNIAAATIGAGVLRGALIEPAAAGLRTLRERRLAARIEEDIDFDLRDAQLQQMFADNSQSPSARAASSVLDDTVFIERNNPYGEGRAASERFIAELRSVQRAINGEAMTAVGRVLPPVPFEYVQREADFVLVKEQRPLVYARMERAQARLQDLTRQTEEAVSRQGPTLIEAVRLVNPEAAGRLEQLAVRVNDEVLPEAARVAADMEAQTIIQRVGVENVSRAAEAADIERRFRVRSLRASRRAANKEYRAEYRKVEAEAARLREAQVRAETAQQQEGANILSMVSEGRPFVGPLLRYDNVGSLVDRINKVNDILEETSAAPFVRAEASPTPAPLRTEGMVTVYRAGIGARGGWFTTSREYAEQLAARDSVPLWEAEVSKTHPVFSGAGEAGDPDLKLTYQTDFAPGEISNARQIAGQSYFTEDGRIDIGLQQPVDPDFRVPTDDGDVSIADLMRDLQDDADLVEAVRSCSI